MAQILVATDVAARGLDIAGVSHVSTIFLKPMTMHTHGRTTAQDRRKHSRLYNAGSRLVRYGYFLVKISRARVVTLASPAQRHPF